jgi:hypothetical protein
MMSAARSHAQLPDTGYSHRALSRFLVVLHSDTRLPDSLRHLTVGGLDSLPSAYFSLLDDAATSFYMHAMASALHQVPQALCGQVFAIGGNLDLTTLLAAIDSTTVDALILSLNRAIHAAATGTPRRVATRSEMQTAILKLTGGLPIADQQRLMRIARNPPPSEEDACWSIRVLIDGLAAMPPEELGPVVRAMSAPSPRPQ